MKASPSQRRIAELERKVARLEAELAALRPKAPARKPSPKVKNALTLRCPGCSIEIEPKQRHCPFCSILLEAIPGWPTARKKPRRR